MKSLLVDMIALTDDYVDKDLEVLNWPNPFYLLKMESLIDIEYNFVNWEYKRSYRDNVEYMLLYVNIENDEVTENDVKRILEEYGEYMVVYDLTKSSKGFTHYEWMVDILEFEILKIGITGENEFDSKFIKKNFIIEKIKNHNEYRNRNFYWKDFFKMKKDAKITSKKYCDGVYRAVAEQFIINENETCTAPYLTQHSLKMYVENFKSTVAGVLYNLMILTVINNQLQKHGINIFLNFDNVERSILFLEIVSDNTELLDYVVNIFMDIVDNNFTGYDIVENTMNVLLQNQIKIFNIADYKEYLILFKK